MDEFLLIACDDEVDQVDKLVVPFTCYFCCKNSKAVVNMDETGRVMSYVCLNCRWRYDPGFVLRDLDLMLAASPMTWQVCSHDGYPLH